MAFDENPDEVFDNEPEAEMESNGDEQSNRSFRMMMIGLFAFGGLGVLLIALLLIGRSGERAAVDAQNQSVQATNQAIIAMSQITPTPLPTDTPMPTNTAAPTNTPAPTATPKPKDLVDTALANSNFKTLSDLLKTAGLVETLKGQGPFTVFAPTNDAFAQLSPESLEALNKDPEKLAALLKYHVVEGALTADSAATISETKTLEGQPVKITVKDGKIQVNDVTVSEPDAETANGLIYPMDQVLIPPEMSKVVVIVPPAPSKATEVAKAPATAVATAKPATGAQATAAVPTRVPPAAATSTAAASKPITNTGTVTGTTGTTDQNLPKTGANDNLFMLVLAAVGLVGVLVAARRLRSSQS